MAVLVLWGLIACVCLLYSAVWQRRFEEGIPFAMSSMALVMYLFALAGQLKAGVYATLGLCAAALAAAVALTTARRGWKALARSTFTPGLLIWGGVMLFVLISNRGKVVHTWDEFTYWADAVKVMCQQGVLPSHPAARSLFASYPPGMPLLQYFVQQIHGIIGGGFAEDLLFMTYQLFLLGLFMPFLSRLSFRRPFAVAMSGLSALLAGTAIFPLAYDLLHIDAFLGAMAGFVCAYALLWHEGGASLATLCTSLAMLTLCKDVGVLFALAGVASYAACLAAPRRRLPRDAVWRVLAALGAVALAWGTWKLHVAAWGASAQETFSNPITLRGVAEVLSGGGEPWRRTTLRNFLYALIEKRFAAQPDGVTVSYTTVLALLALGALWLDRRWQEVEREGFRRVSAICCLTVVAYVIGTCMVYVFKFYEDEAVRLASYQRYLSIAVMMPFFLLFACTLYQQYPNGLGRRATAAALAAFLAAAPWESLLHAATGLYTQAAYQKQEEFLAMEQKTRYVVSDETARLYVVASESGGFEQIVMRYRMRPYVVSDEPWDLLTEGEGDRFTAVLPPEDWMDSLIAGEYDYVLLMKSSDDFRRDYGHLFAQPESIERLRIYRVDSALRKLVLAD